MKRPFWHGNSCATPAMMEIFFRKIPIAFQVVVVCTLLSPSVATAEQKDPPTDNSCDKQLPLIFEKVSPSVVFISALSINPYRPNDRVEHVLGSGFIIDPSGLIVTNSHVAFGRQLIVVTLDDGSTVPAQLVGADPLFDIAVLKIPKPERETLAPVVLGDSDRLRVGEDVVAIGNPMGLDQSLTRGVVSAINRILPETFFSLEEPLIQMDTPINPGNSGGPLVNRCGEVVGITTSVIPDAQNIGFSIPINIAKEMIPGLMKDGRIVRPWLGFHGQFIESGLKEFIRLPLVEGFLVEVVEPESPADKADLHGGQLELSIGGRDFLIGGDIITRINGASVSPPEKMVEILKGLKVGSTVNLMVFRQGKYVDVKYALPERPLLPGDVSDRQLALPVLRKQLGKVHRF
jgi:S1-C subfamily serine protease